MQKLSKYLKGDLALWGVIFFFALISFLPIYSATSNIVYVEGLKGDIFYHFFRHVRLVIFGLVVAYVVHLMPYRYLRPISRLGLFITWILLLLVVMKGSTIEGANASRWLYIFGISVQPSAIAMIVLLVYVASYLAEIYGQKVTLGDSLLPLWLPVGITVGLVTLPNFSTGAIMFSMVITLVFIGRYPLRHIFSVFVLTIVLAGIFYLFVRAYPDAFPHRVDTWRARIERFFNKDEAKEEDYQSQRAKMAIVSGGLLGQGSGKSVMKNLLSKSYSDFIFAIILEEYGLWGGAGIISFFIIMLARFMIISLKAPTIFGKLLVLGVGLPIVFQAFINMGVSVGLLPVTGQNLPFFSSGGSSIVMTCLALGIVLAVSRRPEEELKAFLAEKEAQEKAKELSSEEDSDEQQAPINPITPEN